MYKALAQVSKVFAAIRAGNRVELPGRYA